MRRGSEKEGWEAGPVRIQEVLEEVDGAGQALKQRERTVRHTGKVAMHVHAPVTKLDSPAKNIDEISNSSRLFITKYLNNHPK
jgi:hypothetical protein